MIKLLWKDMIIVRNKKIYLLAAGAFHKVNEEEYKKKEAVA